MSRRWWMVVAVGAMGTGCDRPCGGTPGALTVEAPGLPDGSTARIDVLDADGALLTSVDVPSGGEASVDLEGGEFQLVGQPVAVDDPFVRTVYLPEEATVCVDGDTVASLPYDIVPTSHKLWFAVAGGSDFQLAGIDAGELAETGPVDPTVALAAPVGGALAFDARGNLWASGATVAEPPIQRFAARDLGASGSATADVGVRVRGLDCSPAVSGFAFDGDGNLYLSSPCLSQVLKIDAADLVDGAEVDASAVMTGLNGADALAFDASGSLWVADADGLARYDALDGEPALRLTVLGVGGTPRIASALVFDEAGALWGTDFGANIVWRLDADAQGGSGTDTQPPGVEIGIYVGALLEGLALDEGGGLWIDLEMGQVGRLAPDQLDTASGVGDPTSPATVLRPNGVGYADALVTYPAPAWSPLASAVP